MQQPPNLFDAAAWWNKCNGLINCLILLLSNSFVPHRWIRRNEGIAVLLLIDVLGFILPTIILIKCAAGIKLGNAKAVKTSIVLAWIGLLTYLGVFLVASADFAVMKLNNSVQSEDTLAALFISTIVCCTVIINLIYLIRCKHLLQSTDLTIGRGFEPVMALPVKPIVEPPANPAPHNDPNPPLS